MEKNRIPLKTNIGYLLNKPVGYARDAELKLDEVFIDPDLNVHNLDVRYRFSRIQEGILLQAELKGRLAAQCVRCLEDSFVNVETLIEEVFFFPEKLREETDLVIPDDGYIDLGVLFRDYLLLGLPIHFVCQPDCKGVCTFCGQNLNLKDCGHQDNKILIEE
ncbi:MAG: DUF177 domain-containing protein [Anaerolineaceae bacterium]|nr:DUF177 domain-containing protein [Anaerolineaceae bacterium]